MILPANIYRITFLLFFVGGLFLSCKSQDKGSYWTSIRTHSFKDKDGKKLNSSTQNALYKLNLSKFKSKLFQAVGNKTEVQISLPNINTNFEVFTIWENTSFSPELQQQFPDIRSFSGRSIADKYATVVISYAPNGIQVMITRVDKESEFIELYSNKKNIYVVFNKSDKSSNWNCTTPSKKK